MGYLTYYLAWALASYALRSPWLLLGIVVFFLLRRWLPDPSVYLRTLGRIRGLESAREANPDNVTARRDLARLYLERGRPRKALVYVEEAQRRAPDDAELSYLHGVCLQRTGRHEEALGPLVRAVDLDPRLAFGEPYRWAAEALAALGRLDQAEDAWLRYLDVSSSSVDARVRLAGVLARAGRRKEAAERVDEAIRTHRELPGFAARKQLGARVSAEVARVTIKREPAAIVVALVLSALAVFVTMRAVSFVRTHDLGTGKRGHVAGRPLLPRPGVATGDDEMDEPEEVIAEDMRPDPTQFRRVPPGDLASRGVTWAKQPTGSGLMGNVVAIQVLCGLVGTYGPADRDEDGQLVFAFLDTKTSTYWGVRLREGELVWGTPTALHETNPQADFRLFRRMMALSLVASTHGQSDGPPDCTLEYRKNGQPHRMGYRRGETFSEAVAVAPSAASSSPAAASSPASPSGSAPARTP